MNADEYRQADGIALGQRVAKKEVSAKELTDLAREQIARHNPSLNAVVHHFDPPIADAPFNSPLTGVPSLLKDMLDVDQTPMSLGSRLLKDNVCTFTHPIAQQMINSGISLIGRTNMPELGLVPLTEPNAFGLTRNPWSLAHSPGGSSGGAAAAVASGMVPFAHGTDGGGSIRIPSSACGLVGLKPTQGIHAFHSSDEPIGFIVNHCLSRTVRDSAAFFDIITKGGPTHITQSALTAIQTAPRSLRVGLLDHGFFHEALHPDVSAAVHHSAKQLEALGHSVQPVRLPCEPEVFVEAFSVVWAAATEVFFRKVQDKLGQSELPALIKLLLKSKRILRMLTTVPLPDGRLVEPFTHRMLSLARPLKPADLWLAISTLRAVANQMHHFFNDHDCVLAPVLTAPPWTHGQIDPSKSIAQLSHELFSYIGHSPIANATGIPSVAIPSTRNATGLPIGVQLMGPMGSDIALLQLAAQLERSEAWLPGLLSR